MEHEERTYAGATSNISIKVQPQLHAKFMREAKEIGMSLSEYMRNLLMTEGENQHELLAIQRENKELKAKLAYLQNENDTLASNAQLSHILIEMKRLLEEIHQRDVQSYQDHIAELQQELAEINESEDQSRKQLQNFQGKKYECQVERNRAIDEMLEQASKRFALVVHEMSKDAWQPKAVAKKMWTIFKGNPQADDAWADLKQPEKNTTPK